MQTEKMGLGRMEPGVSLYSRKVLIESHSKNLLPDWMRFVYGVVDSDDIPLSRRRENSRTRAGEAHPQDPDEEVPALPQREEQEGGVRST